ncbi:MAG: 50S ribosomal protein L10 [Candidatus Brocadiia bacterium]
MPSRINKLQTEELAQRFRGLSHAVVVDFTGLSAPQADELRALLAEHGGTMMVVKNSLAVRALEQLELPDVAALVDGPTAFVTGSDDPVALSKRVMDWSRKARVLKVRGGVVEGKALSAQEVQRLAELPSLDVLRAQAVGAIASPLSGLVGALQAVVRNVAAVLQAIAEKQGES